MATDSAAELVRLRRQQKPLPTRLIRALATFIVKKPLGACGLGIISAMIFLALAAPIVTFHDPMKFNLREMTAAPSTTYWLGTDDYGRDMWSRIVLGARISLFVGFGSVALGSRFQLIVKIINHFGQG